MPNRVRVLAVPDADRAELERRARSKGAPARVVARARIVLLAADGLTGAQIAGRAGCTEPTVIKWRRQYAERGLAGLEDAPRPGGPKTVLTDEVVRQILAATVTSLPEPLRAAGLTRWSSRRLADWLAQDRGIRVSHDSITVLWHRFCLQPHRTEGFTFSTGSQLPVIIRDVVGLYLAPPDNAVVVCVDEKPQIQAPERTRRVLAMRPGIPERHTHDCIRHGTTAWFAALEVATGTVTDACYPRHRHGEFLCFVTKVAAAYPGEQLHVVCDNDATHQHAEVRAWLTRPQNRRVMLHLVPAGCSWLNLVECFFSIITRPATRRGSLASDSELIAAIGAFIDGWNDHPRPFTWTNDADEILASIQRAKTKTSSFTHH